MNESDTTDESTRIAKEIPELRDAIHNWVDENAFRFVRPSREYWPDHVNSREEATEYYGDKATAEIINDMVDSKTTDTDN